MSEPEATPQAGKTEEAGMESLEIGEPDSLSGTFVAEIAALRKDVERLTRERETAARIMALISGIVHDPVPEAHTAADTLADVNTIVTAHNVLEAHVVRLESLVTRLVRATPHSLCSDAEAWTLADDIARAALTRGEEGHEPLLR